MLRRLATALAVVACAIGAVTAHAADVTVDPAKINLGFMNVSNLPPPNGDGAYQFGSPWGFGDLTASYSGSDLILGPNTVGDPNEYWYRCVGSATPPNCGGPGAPGNKIMEANAYAEVNDGSLAGQTVNFTGVVLSNTLTPAHVVYAFIKDFAPDYSSFVGNVVALTTTGTFSLSLNTINDPARHVQYGFQTVGVNVWVTDVGPYGTMVIGPDAAVPAEKNSWGRLKALYR